MLFVFFLYFCIKDLILMGSKLFFYYGSMGAGKSAHLLIKAYNLREHGMNVLLIKPSIDTRDGNNVIKTRIGISQECLMVSPTDNICDIVKDGETFPDWILTDESQFFTEEQIDQLADIVDDFDINVVCYGLRADFRTKLFPGSKRLFEVADTIKELKQICSCGKKAIINARMDSNGNIVTNGNQVEVGGNDKYISLCRKCYNRIVKNFNK